MLRVCGMRAAGPTSLGSAPSEGDPREILPPNEDMVERKLPSAKPRI